MSRSMIRVALSLVSLTLAGQAGAAGEATVQGSLDKAVILPRPGLPFLRIFLWVKGLIMGLLLSIFRATPRCRPYS